MKTLRPVWPGVFIFATVDKTGYLKGYVALCVQLGITVNWI